MTMPFMAHDDGFPAALGTNETIIVWWAPFEKQPRQALVQLITYSALLVTVVGLTGFTLKRDTQLVYTCRRQLACLSEQKRWKYEHPNCEICRHKYSIKVETILFLSAARYALSIALCAASIAHTPHTGAVSIINVLVSLLDNGIGVWFLLCFAVHCGLPPLPLPLKRCYEAASTFYATHASAAAAASGHEPGQAAKMIQTNSGQSSKGLTVRPTSAHTAVEMMDEVMQVPSALERKREHMSLLLALDATASGLSPLPAGTPLLVLPQHAARVRTERCAARDDESGRHGAAHAQPVRRRVGRPQRALPKPGRLGHVICAFPTSWRRRESPTVARLLCPVARPHPCAHVLCPWHAGRRVVLRSVRVVLWLCALRSPVCSGGPLRSVRVILCGRLVQLLIGCGFWRK
eukprot:CAMPEP_0115830112 /NCGR_PEP_ID=MMETSP0287-20121206/1449_1 /TAXON_ID=412157 /ORGANISM="Chrysochromulina rotalis, Strain UIO044" /LENGTH=404 /DNA_ID=CAMNT_0003283405 /DNA_START=149 /DNA_END=1364 /DNA_ORIENTATION=+